MSATATLSRPTTRTALPVGDRRADVERDSDSTIDVRPVAPADAAVLDDASQPPRRLPTAVLRWMTDVDGVDHVAVVAERTGALVGIARYVRVADDPDVAEVAVTVADAHQGCGIGAALARELREIAVEHGIRAFRVVATAGNREALDVLRAHRAYIVAVDGVLEGHLDLI